MHQRASTSYLMILFAIVGDLAVCVSALAAFTIGAVFRCRRVVAPAAGIALCLAACAAPFPDTPENRASAEQAEAMLHQVEAEHGHFAEVNGVRMHFLTWGEQSDPALLWAHGSGSSAFELLEVGPLLAKGGYFVISIDYRGHGQTIIEDYGFSIYDVADDMVALLDHMGIDTAIIGGLSKGGWIAAAFYDAYPDRTRALILEDGGSFSSQEALYGSRPGPLGRFINRRLAAYQQGLEFESAYDVLAMMSKYYLPKLNRTMVPEMGAMALGFMEQASDGSWHSATDSIALYGIGVSFDASQVPLLQRSQNYLLPEIVFRHLDVPMLIIDPVSADDFLDATSENKRLKERFPLLVQHEIYKDCLHEAHVKHPKKFARDVLAFLEGAASQISGKAITTSARESTPHVQD